MPGINAIYWTGIVLTAAHFGLSYHLAYNPGASALRTRPFALVIAPLVLVVMLACVIVVAMAAGKDSVGALTKTLITSVYLLTTWHYVKQVYGVGRITAAYAGIKLGAWDVKVLRYGLYPLWFLGAAQVLVPGANYRLAGFEVGFSLLPTWVYPTLRVLALVSVIPILVVFVGVAKRTHRLPASAFVAPYVASFLWLGLPTNPLLTLLLLAPFHALQYLAVGHRAEVAVAADRPGEHGMTWWLNIFVGAGCGGLLLSRWAPQFIDSHIQHGRGPLLFSAAFFVFLNMHHYVIDAAIWRSNGDLVKAMGRKTTAAVVRNAGEPAGELVAI
jgi:hypothetical protein